MSDLHLAHLSLLPACAGFGAGVLLGASHFLTLHWNVRMLALGRAQLIAMTLQLARFALLAVALALIARIFGALPLVVATAGIIAARVVALSVGGLS
jgi:F1F0 ATPase subunit 2